MGRINRTLLELCVGITLFGVVCQMTIVWFVSAKLSYSIGLWIGILLSIFSGMHMWWALERSIHSESAAVKKVTQSSLIRYLVITLVLLLVIFSKVINPLATFLGLMGLKVSAYIQPFTHKLVFKLYDKERVIE